MGFFGIYGIYEIFLGFVFLYGNKNSTFSMLFTLLPS